MDEIKKKISSNIGILNIENVLNELNLSYEIDKVNSDDLVEEFSVFVNGKDDLELLIMLLSYLVLKEVLKRAYAPINRNDKEEGQIIESVVFNDSYYIDTTSIIVSEYLSKFDVVNLDVFIRFNLKGLNDELSVHIKDLVENLSNISQTSELDSYLSDAEDASLLEVVEALKEVAISQKDTIEASKTISVFWDKESITMKSLNGEVFNLREIEEYIGFEFDEESSDLDRMTKLEKTAIKHSLMFIYSAVFLDTKEFIFHSDFDNELLEAIRHELMYNNLFDYYELDLLKCKGCELC